MTLRLLGLAEDHWEDIDGYAAGHGFDPVDLPLARLANFVWWWVTANAQEKDLQKFKGDLWRPPIGEQVTHKKSPWAPENENSALSDLKQALGGAPSMKAGDSTGTG